ncbi:hypothetical protein ACPDHJ_07395 [Myroides sp. C8-3]|uniref:hypothetical protein n=1 Tax=Myroides sp. C8-3 TaxID=3400533 RepID=UPI003D2F7AA9
MRKYTENKALMLNIESNNVKELKINLIENIFFVQGDLVQINQSIEYAKNNSDFDFEPHVDIPLLYDINSEEAFSEEKYNMRTNFSKERFDMLLKIYHKVYVSESNTVETIKDNVTTPSNSKNFRIGVCVVGAAILGYLIYKILD